MFYFGNAFNVLVNVTSVGLNGVIELLVPAILFLFFSSSFHKGSMRIGGVHATVHTWRRVTIFAIVLIVALIATAYTLNACVRMGVYGPLHKARHQQSEEDYSHYAAYDDLSAPPGPPGAAAAPALAPAAAVAEALVR